MWCWFLLGVLYQLEGYIHPLPPLRFLPLLLRNLDVSWSNQHKAPNNTRLTKSVISSISSPREVLHCTPSNDVQRELVRGCASETDWMESLAQLT